MKLTWKLTLAYAWRHPPRMLLTSLAMIASACVVVWVVGSYDAMAGKFGDTASEYLGRYDLFVVPDATKEQESYISSDLIASLRKDTAIAECEPVLQASVKAQSENGPPIFAGPGRPGASGPGSGRQGAGGPPPERQRAGQQGGPGVGMGGPAAGRPGPGGRGGMMMFGRSPDLVGTNAEKPPYALAEGRWIRHGDPALRETVLSNVAAESLQVKLNDDVLVIFGTKEYRLKIVGIATQAASQPLAEKPAGPSPTGRPMMRMRTGPAIGPSALALYVPMALAEKITKQSGKINLVNIKLKQGVDAAKFRSRWASQMSQAKPAVLLIGVQDLKAAMEEGMMAGNAKRQAWAATGISLLAALFIIFTTLSMGVNERVRQFAVMRAIGLTRGQVARVIAAESLVLALIGWGGGLLAGWGMLTVVSAAKPDLFQNGASLGWWCVLLTGASALGGAIVASLLPAWQATRVEPLDAMSPRRTVRPSMKLAAIFGAIGLALISVNPLLVYTVPIPDAARYGIYEAIGCTSMAVGFLLLAPLAIIVTEATIGPVVARLAGLEPRLLASQLSSNLWRTLGTTLAMTVGLGLYVAMLVWGYSMLEPFRPGQWVPDVLAAFQTGGLPDSEIAAMKSIKGVIPEQCIPLAVEQPRLAGDITESELGNSVTHQDNVIIIGLDPEAAFGGKNPLIRAEFTIGTPEEAVAKLKQGRYCIVPDHFLAAAKLRVGDRFSMIPPEKPDKPVEYTIAGAVSLPGWHWMTKFSGLRRRDGRSAAMVFAPYEDVRRDFGIKQINFFWMNIDKTAIENERPARRESGATDATSMGGEEDEMIAAKQAALVKIAAAMRPIADRNLGEKQPVNAQGTWGGPGGPAATFGESLRITTPETIRTRVTGRADDMIWAMCELPLITLLVTSLGVVNTIMASVRARRRRWFGRRATNRNGPRPSPIWSGRSLRRLPG